MKPIYQHGKLITNKLKPSDINIDNNNNVNDKNMNQRNEANNSIKQENAQESPR